MPTAETNSMKGTMKVNKMLTASARLLDVDKGVDLVAVRT